MKTLMQELNNILEEKNSKIALLEWENQMLREENKKLVCELDSRRASNRCVSNEIANAV